MALLTKSRYIKAFQCKKLFCLSLNQPEVLDTDDMMQYRFDEGHLVGIQARLLFPDGLLIEHSLPFQDKISKTKACIENGQTVFEGAFYWNQCFCLVDALTYRDGAWDLVEVKSSTSVKPIHLHDVGFQTFLLSQLGIDVRSVFVCHIDTSYVRLGDLDVFSLFKMQDVTADVKACLSVVRRNVHDYLLLLKKPTAIMPIGEHCFSPYACQGISHCWKDIPEGSIFELTELSIQEKLATYFKGDFMLSDVTPDSFSRVRQKCQIACVQEGLDFIDTHRLSQFMAEFSFPISFLDFECFQMAIPPYDGTLPYEQIPFQFSLHINDQASLTHDSFIAPYGTDPREIFLGALIDKLPDFGSVVVFNRQYESMILSKLKHLFPESASFIDDVLDRMIDLEDPFKKNYVYFRDMLGKTSIKNILPALCPTMSYDQLAISSGRSINHMYHRLANDEDDDAIAHLYEYGRLDTYAMHLILEQLLVLLRV